MLLLTPLTPEGIPAGALLVAGYIDGQWPNYEKMKQVHPHAYVIPITVTGRANVRVADCEKGNLSAPSAAAWAVREIKSGHRPTIYSSVSKKPEIVAELHKLGLSETLVDWWGAHWFAVGKPPTFTPPIPHGYVAIQFAANVPHNGHSYDETVTNGQWPHPVAAPEQQVHKVSCDLKSCTDPKSSTDVAHLNNPPLL